MFLPILNFLSLTQFKNTLSSISVIPLPPFTSSSIQLPKNAKFLICFTESGMMSSDSIQLQAAPSQIVFVPSGISTAPVLAQKYRFLPFLEYSIPSIEQSFVSGFWISTHSKSLISFSVFIMSITFWSCSADFTISLTVFLFALLNSAEEDFKSRNVSIIIVLPSFLIIFLTPFIVFHTINMPDFPAGKKKEQPQAAPGLQFEIFIIWLYTFFLHLL